MTNFKDVLKDVNKTSPGLMKTLSEDDMTGIDRIPTGILSLDTTLGGGLPKGKIVECYGREGCLDSETLIEYRSSDGRQKIATIKELYEIFHAEEEPKLTTVSVSPSGQFIYNTICDVVESGVKECFKVTAANGNEIIATADHRFLTKSGFNKLSGLEIGGSVMVKRNHVISAMSEDIVSIESVGERETYDIKMLAPHNNFVANDFVVHNSGKSCIATMLAGQAQKHGEVIYIDLENAFDPAKAENSGVDVDSLYVPQPDSAEDTLELIEKLVIADDVSLIVVDSTAAMVTEAEINGDMGDVHVGQLARLLSSGLKKIVNTMNKNDSQAIVFFVNQVRDLIGTFGHGPKTTTPGGKALRFYSSTRLDVARIGPLKQGEEIIGQTVKVKAVKSRFSAPFKTANFDLYYDSGVSNESSIIDTAIELGYIIKGGGGWMTDAATGEKLAHGKPKLIAYMAENPEYAQEISEKVLGSA